LAKLTYKLAEERKIQLVFGFPNKNSLPGFQNKLDWKFYGSMQNFTISNSVLPLCEFSSKFKFFHHFTINFVNSGYLKFRIDLTTEKYKRA